MSAAAGDGITGLGATMVLSQTGAVGIIQSIQLPNWVSQKVDFSGIQNTEFMTYNPGVITDPGDVVASVFFDPRLEIKSNGVVEDCTVTLPKLNAAASAGGIIAGSGFMIGKQMPNLAINEAALMSVTFSYDGKTGPTYTKEPAPT